MAPPVRKIAVAFDRATFKRIAALAKREGKSFTAMAEYVARCGLLCIEESDRHELDLELVDDETRLARNMARLEHLDGGE